MPLYHTIANPNLTWIQTAGQSVFVGSNPIPATMIIVRLDRYKPSLFNLAGHEDNLKAAVEKD